MTENSEENTAKENYTKTDVELDKPPKEVIYIIWCLYHKVGRVYCSFVLFDDSQ